MKYAIYVFLAGCSYGMLATLIKLAYGLGFSVGEVVGAQYTFGFLILGAVVLLMPKTKLTLKTILSLMFVGVFTGLTGIFYAISLNLLAAALAVVLLFQYIWIGILIEAIIEKTIPSRGKLVSVFVLFLGTLMAGGIIGASNMSFNLLGVLIGLLAAICFAIFIRLTSKTPADVPVLTRAFWMSLGTVLITIIIYPPEFLINGSLNNGLFKYGLLLALLCPILAPLLFAKGTPLIGSGLSTILSSSELPVAILMSALILKESVTIIQWIGTFFILLGIAIPYIFAYFKQDYSSKSLVKVEK